MAFRGSRDAVDYGRRPVTCNTCNYGGFLPFLLLQVARNFLQTGCNSVSEGESRAFSRFCRSLELGLVEVQSAFQGFGSGPTRRLSSEAIRS